MGDDVVADVVSGRHRDRQYKEALGKIELLEAALAKVVEKSTVLERRLAIAQGDIHTLARNPDDELLLISQNERLRRDLSNTRIAVKRLLVVYRSRLKGNWYEETAKRAGLELDEIGAIKHIPGEWPDKEPPKKAECPTCWGMGKKLGKCIGPRKDCRDCGGTGERDGKKFFAPDNDAVTHCTHCHEALDAHHGDDYRCYGAEHCDTCNDTGYIHEHTGGGTKPRTPGTPAIYGLKITRIACPKCTLRKIFENVRSGKIDGLP